MNYKETEVLSKEQIEFNYNYFKELLKSTKREGIDQLLEYIDTTDFSLSPASASYHHSYLGGLVVHTLEVYKNAVELNKAMKFKISDEEMIIAALLHDLCKANTYDTYKRNVKIDGKWHEVDAFTNNDKWPIGHASKSIIIAQMFIKLNDLEISMIYGHMGPFDGNEHFYTALTQKYPEAILMHTADMLSSKDVKIYEEAQNA